MKRFFVFCVLLSISLTGCATFEGKDITDRVDKVERRVSTLEKKQSVSDTQSTSTAMTDYTSQDVSSSSGTASSTTASLSNKQIQTALQKAGYYNGPIDGKIGANSRKAIRKFQTDHGLKVDGVAGPQTMGALSKYLPY